MSDIPQPPEQPSRRPLIDWARVRYPLAAIGVVTAACLPFILVGPHIGHSLVWNISWSRGFTEALLSGEWYPRWLPRLFEGAGSPIFFFYGSMPFYFTAVGNLLCPGCSGQVQLGIGEWLIVTASAMAFYTFARGHAGPRAAAAGAVVYALLPYHFAIDLCVRQALGETAAYIWMPLALLGVDRIAHGKPGVVRLAVAYALLAMTHLPSTLLFSGFLVVYAGLWAWTRRSPATVMGSLGGVALGIVLAGVYLVPALRLQDAISPQFLWGTYFRYDRWQFWSRDTPRFWFLLRLLYVIGVTTLAWLVLWVRVLRTSRHEDRLRAVAWGLFVAGAWFLMTPLSRPLWEALPVLQKVQFPWRVAIVVDLAVAATTVLAIERIDFSARRRAAVVCLVFAVLPVVFSLVFTAQWGRWDLSQRQQHRDKIVFLDEAGLPPEEYLTPWTSGSLVTIRAALLAAPGLFHQSSDAGEITVLRRAPRRIQARVAFERPAEVVVRQFYFPGWVARSEGWREPIRARPSPPYGLTALSLPAGRYDVDIVLSRTWQETAGLATSALGVLIAAAIAIGGRRRRASLSRPL